MNIATNSKVRITNYCEFTNRAIRKFATIGYSYN